VLLLDAWTLPDANIRVTDLEHKQFPIKFYTFVDSLEQCLKESCTRTNLCSQPQLAPASLCQSMLSESKRW
jgi:hypothetical protein